MGDKEVVPNGVEGGRVLHGMPPMEGLGGWRGLGVPLGSP